MKRKPFTLVEIMIVVAIIGLLATVAIPSFVQARLNAQRQVCINNLRVLHDGGRQFRWEDAGAQIDLTAVNDYIQQDTATMHCPGNSAFGYAFEFEEERGQIPVCTNPGVDDHLLPHSAAE